MKFQLNLYTKSQTAERLKINNTPNKKEIEKLKIVHKNIVEKTQNMLLFWIQGDLKCNFQEFTRTYRFLTGEQRVRLKKNLKKIEVFLKKNGTHPFVTSGFRSKALNKAIKGSKNSQHSKAEAVDCEILGVCNWSLWCVLRAHLLFDQLILEFHKDGKDQSGWIHVSFVSYKKNRGQTFRLPR